MNIAIFTVGLVVFVTYMFFLVRMISRQNMLQDKEHGKDNYKTQKIDSNDLKGD